MSFWNLSDNSNAADTGNTFETGGGDMKPIPSNTRLKAMIDDAKWDSFDEDRFISLRWTVLEPESYKNRKVFQKVKVYGTSRDKDPQKAADKAKRMLAAVDSNAGGQLSNLQQEPTDMDLQSALVNKPMLIEVQVWEMTGDDGQQKSGNWVSRVAPANSESVTGPSPADSQDSHAGGVDDDDIPF